MNILQIIFDKFESNKHIEISITLCETLFCQKIVNNFMYEEIVNNEVTRLHRSTSLLTK